MSVSSPKRLEYLHELDYLRGLSIIGVLLIHVVSQIVWKGGASVGDENYAMFWNQWSRFCVPAFIFISGLLLTYRNEPGTFRYYRFVKRRAVDLLVPYVLWTLLSIMNLHKWGTINPDWIRRVVFTGWGYYFQLYFIPLIFQFYILSPVFLWLFWGRRGPVFAAIAVLFNIAYLGYYQMTFLHIMPQTEFTRTIFNNIQGNFPAWVGYFALGCLVGQRVDSFRTFVSRMSWWLIGPIYAAALGLLLWDYYYSVTVTGNLMNPGENFMRPVVMLYSAAAILLFWKVALLRPDTRFLRTLGNYSFGIYLVHIAFHNLLKSIQNGALYSNWFGASIAFLIVLALSYGFTWLFNQDEDGWIVVGKSTSQKRRSSVTENLQTVEPSIKAAG